MSRGFVCDLDSLLDIHNLWRAELPLTLHELLEGHLIQHIHLPGKSNSVRSRHQEVFDKACQPAYRAKIMSRVNVEVEKEIERYEYINLPAES